MLVESTIRFGARSRGKVLLEKGENRIDGPLTKNELATIQALAKAKIVKILEPYESPATESQTGLAPPPPKPIRRRQAKAKASAKSK